MGSASIRQRVQAARERQRQRLSKNGSLEIVSSAGMRVEAIRQLCTLRDESQSLLRAAMTQLNLLARAYHRTQSMKLARTIADLAGSEEIQSVIWQRRSNIGRS